MKYLKCIFVGVAASTVTVIAFGVIAVAVMSHFPEVAVHIFPAERHELGWGEFYGVDFPLWLIVIVGLLTFAIAFGWMLKRASLAQAAAPSPAKEHQVKRKTALSLLVVCLVSESASGQIKDAGKTTQSTNSSPKSADKRTTAKTEKKAYFIDINSAPKVELWTLPGIDDAYAQKIIDGRPYRAKKQLVQENIIPQDTYDKIADSIIAKRNAAAAKKAKAGDKGSKKRDLIEVAR